MALAGKDCDTPRKKNKGRRILIVDILVLAFLFVLYNLFFSGPGSKFNDWGYSAELKALEYEDSVLVSLQIEATGDSAGDGQVIEFHFIDSTGQEAFIYDVLPVSKGDSRRIQARLKLNGASAVRVLFVVNEQLIELEQEI